MSEEVREAQRVLNSVDNDIHPPTNPAVLLAAARTIYLNQGEFPGAQLAIMRVLVWTLNVIKNNSGLTFYGDVHHAFGVLEFNRGQLAWLGGDSQPEAAIADT